MLVTEIRVKQIRVNQGLGVEHFHQKSMKIMLDNGLGTFAGW